MLTATTDIPPLVDLLQILPWAGAVLGAIVGFAVAANNSSAIVKHASSGAAIGGVLGAIFAFVIAFVDAIA